MASSPASSQTSSQTSSPMDDLLYELGIHRKLMERMLDHLRHVRNVVISGTTSMQPFKLKPHRFTHDFIFNTSSASVTLVLLTEGGLVTLTLPSATWVTLGFEPESEILSVTPNATLIYKESMDVQP